MPFFNDTTVSTDSATLGEAFAGRVWSRRIPFILAGLWCLTPWGSPGVALAVGAALAIVIGNPDATVTSKASKHVLKTCVVLLGFAMDLPTVLHAGLSGIVFAACTILSTLALGYITGKLLKIPGQTSLLISAGTAICGGSAIAAVGSVIDAEQSAMTVAMGTVFLLNAAALYLFPIIGHMLHLDQHAFGTWAGVAIHDISSVVGAAAAVGPVALNTATAVKLSRALWIVPLVVVISFVRRRQMTPAQSGEGKPSGRLPIPWFIGLFVLASVVRSLVPGLASFSPDISHVAETGMTLALFLIGAGLSRRVIVAVGWRAIAQGLILWIVISTTSLWVVTRYVH